MQETNQDTRGIQVESLPQCSWWTTRTWHSLLGYLHPSSDMANGAVLYDTVHPSMMAQLPTRLRQGVPTSTRRDAALHAATTRLQAQQDDEEDTRSQADTQCVWPRTSWPGLEQVHGPGHVRDRLHP